MFFLLTLGSALFFACGNTLEKSGISGITHSVPVRNPLRFIGSILRNPRWLLGFFCSILASLGYYLAMARYDISIVQPMMALNPVLTAALGYLILKERLNRRIILAIAVVVGGLAFAAPHAGLDSSVQNTFALWLFALAVILISFSVRLFKKDHEVSDSLIAGAGFGLSAVFYKSLSLDFQFSADLSFRELLPWLLDARLWAFVFIYITAFVYSQMAFTRGRALFIIPLSAAVGAAIPILAGGAVFSEPFPLLKVISVSLVLAGSCLFVAGKKH
ncbi:MAG: EamA family transporter [Fibrobacter sp.]|jgi:drug/metabolite transporter (DMT)-like permease|nr:EamA family transporter [Fibrobacter sp.]